MLGRPAIAELIARDQSKLRQRLEQLGESGDDALRDEFLRQHRAFTLAVRSVLIDFLARAFVRGPELRSRFDALTAPARLEALGNATGEALRSVGKRLAPRFEECARFIDEEVVPLAVGLLEETELAELSRDYRLARDAAG